MHSESTGTRTRVLWAQWFWDRYVIQYTNIKLYVVCDQAWSEMSWWTTNQLNEYLVQDNLWQPSSPWQEVWHPPLLPPRCWWCWASWAVCSNSCRERCWGHPESPSGGLPPAWAARFQELRRPEQRTLHEGDWWKKRKEKDENQVNQQEKEKIIQRNV